MSVAQVLPFLKLLGAAPPNVGGQPAPSSGEVATGIPGGGPDPSANFSAQDVATGIPSGAQTGPPPETKGHKLLRILQGGLVGGLNGLAADAQTYAQTGRNAGFGGGFLGATQIPFQQAMQQQQLQQSQAQTELLKQQGQMIQTPGGPMPLGLAKVFYPALIRSQTAENVQGQKSATAQTVAGINKRFISVPNVGVLDTQTLGADGKPSLVPDTGQGITLTQQHIDDYNLPQALLGKQMTATQLAMWERAQAQQIVPVQGANGTSLVNKQKASKGQPGAITNLGLGNPAMGRPMEIPDVNNPGQTVVTTGGAAQGQAGKGSASLAVAKQGALSELPKNVGDLKVAFNTMIDHADLLRQAAKAVNNGDVKTIANLKNRLKTEFGDGDYTTLQAIANAYNHEVTTVIAKGHMTDSEVGTGNRTLPVDANFSTINQVLNAYQDLGRRKMKQLDLQKQSAINQSQPNKQGQIHPAAQQYLNQLNGNTPASNQRP